MAPRPNFVVICTDQLRYDALGANGNAVARTPHIDAIARAGVTLDRHITPNQICSPSRATLATGLYPRHHGLWRNGAALDPTLPTLWSTLHGAGYATRAVGKLHFQPLLAPAERAMPESLAYWERPDAAAWHGPYHGFEHVELVLGEANESVRAGHYAAWLRSRHPDSVHLYDPDALVGTRAPDLPEVWTSGIPAALHYTTWIADRAVEAIESADAARPLALFVSFPDPHHPFAPPRPYADLFDPASVPDPVVRPGELERMPAYLASGDDPAKDAYIAAGEPVREQGFLLRTDAISSQTLKQAIAHTYGMVAMIDDAVGRISRALAQAPGGAPSYRLFTADHGELLGDHGLLRKGPPPYRQLLQVPLILSGPRLAPGTRSAALTSHVDLCATLASLLDVTPPETDGLDLTPVLTGETERLRDCLFAEYHPRADPRLYNRTIITADWRLTLYPAEPAWGELFELRTDPWEHENLFSVPDHASVRDELRAVLDRTMPAQPEVKSEILGPY